MADELFKRFWRLERDDDAVADDTDYETLLLDDDDNNAAAAAHRRVSKRDVAELVRAILAVGGNIRTLVRLDDNKRSGLLAKCVQIPNEDLFAYVLRRHCCLRVCYGAVGLAANSSWQSRLVLVGVSLLWSLSANCLVSAIVLRDQSRMTQVVVITVADSTGVTILSTLFYLAHVPLVSRLLHATTLDLPAIFTTTFCFVTLILLLVSLTPDELYLAVYSFLPIWCTARVYELFEKGTLWALQVQLGSYPTTSISHSESHRLLPPAHAGEARRPRNGAAQQQRRRAPSREYRRQGLSDTVDDDDDGDVQHTELGTGSSPSHQTPPPHQAPGGLFSETGDPGGGGVSGRPGGGLPRPSSTPDLARPQRLFADVAASAPAEAAAVAKARPKL